MSLFKGKTPIASSHGSSIMPIDTVLTKRDILSLEEIETTPGIELSYKVPNAASILEKVSVNQGVENAGKILMISAEGKVVAADLPIYAGEVE